MITLSIILLISIFSVQATVPTPQQTAELIVLLNDVNNNFGSYTYWFLFSGRSIPAGIIGAYEAVHNAQPGDYSYTTLFTELDITQLLDMATAVPWYSSYLSAEISEAIAKVDAIVASTTISDSNRTLGPSMLSNPSTATFVPISTSVMFSPYSDNVTSDLQSESIVTSTSSLMAAPLSLTEMSSTPLSSLVSTTGVVPENSTNSNSFSSVATSDNPISSSYLFSSSSSASVSDVTESVPQTLFVYSTSPTDPVSFNSIDVSTILVSSVITTAFPDTNVYSESLPVPGNRFLSDLHSSEAILSVTPNISIDAEFTSNIVMNSSVVTSTVKSHSTEYAYPSNDHISALSLSSIPTVSSTDPHIVLTMFSEVPTTEIHENITYSASPKKIAYSAITNMTSATVVRAYSTIDVLSNGTLDQHTNLLENIGTSFRMTSINDTLVDTVTLCTASASLTLTKYEEDTYKTTLASSIKTNSLAIVPEMNIVGSSTTITITICNEKCKSARSEVSTVIQSIAGEDRMSTEQTAEWNDETYLPSTASTVSVSSLSGSGQVQIANVPVSKGIPLITGDHMSDANTSEFSKITTSLSTGNIAIMDRNNALQQIVNVNAILFGILVLFL